MSNNFQREKENKRERRSRKMTITSSVGRDMPLKSYAPTLGPFLPSSYGVKSQLFVRREERDAQSIADRDEVERSSVQQRHKSLNSIPPALSDVCFSDYSDPETSVFHDDSSSFEDYGSYNMEEDRSDLKLIEELKIARKLLRPVRNTMKSSGLKEKRRARRQSRRKRGSSLEREISMAVLETAATAATGSTESHFLVSSYNAEEVDRKSAIYILSDLVQEGPPSVPEQTKSGYSQSSFEKDEVVPPSVEPSSVEPPTTASNGLHFEDLLKYHSVDTPLASNESKEESVIDIDINKLELDDVGNELSIDEDPFQGLNELDDCFSWREISDSFTSKSLDGLEIDPQEQRCNHDRGLAEYPDDELLLGQILDRSRPEVGDFDGFGTESDGEPAMKEPPLKPSVAENESPAGEAHVPDQKREESGDSFAVDDDAWMSFGGSEFFAPVAGLQTDKNGFPTTVPEENAPIYAARSSSWNPPSQTKTVIDPSSDTRRYMSPERKGFSHKKMIKPGSPVSVVEFRSKSKNGLPRMGKRTPWQNAPPDAMSI